MKPGLYTVTFLGKELPFYYITDKTEALTFISRLLAQTDSLWGLDTETYALEEYKKLDQAALSPHLAKVRLIQIYTGKTGIIFDCLKIGDDRIFKELLERGHFVLHNAVFDLGFFYKWFGISKINAGCTYLLAKLIIHATTPNDKGMAASLRNLVNIVFKEEILKEMQQSNWGETELTYEQISYSCLDAISTYYLAEALAPKLQKLGLERIYTLYKEAQHPIVKMQLNGLKLDVDRHRDMIVTWRADLYKARKELTALTGLSEITAASVGDWLTRSLPPEVLEVWPRTETGRMSTDANTFADFDFVSIVKPFTEFQKREKLCTSFGNSLIEQVNPATHRLHASYRLAGARTGRLSCSEPNLHQLPRDASVRANFIPEPGRVFVCADYSQIEIRVGAELSRDNRMLTAYRNGEDLHVVTAELISKRPLSEMSKEERKSARQKAKAFNFGLMFGLGAKKFSHYAKKSYGADVSPKEAQEGVDAFRETYSGYREWQLRQAEIGASQGFVCTPCGKRRCLERDNSYGPSMNTPIQGGACECMLYALIKLNDTLPSNIGIVNCVHDEVLLECPDTPLAIHNASVCLESAMKQGFLAVFPNGITNKITEAHSGKNWNEAKG